MINTNYSVASLLSNIYNTNASAIQQSQAMIASGKRIQNPSDDFAGYIKAQAMQTDISGYTDVKAGLQNAKGLTDYAKTTGNQILADLTDMKSLATQWAAANAANSSDTDALNGLQAKYDAIVTEITDLKTNATYNGTAVYAASSLGTWQVNGEDSSLTVDVSPSNVANEANVNDITSANAVADLKTEITEGEKFVSQADSFGREINNYMKLADVAVSSKQAAMSAITDVNEVTEMANLTNLLVRQQASVSMMSQANASQAAIAKLFA
jgi:flagellin-like hook-associated protein FlgL